MRQSIGGAPLAGPILVVGATGDLGGRVARRLLASGVPVRALGRNAERLTALTALGAEAVRADLRDRMAVEAACAGAPQVVSTANGFMGTGPSSPTRVDVAAYRILCAAAAAQGVERLVHVSALGVAADSPVDYFRVKQAVDDVITAGPVPWVLVQPSAFMDLWITRLLGEPIRTRGKVTLFGDGRRVANFIAADDVADFLVAILRDRTVVRERVALGGPSTLSYVDVVARIERATGATARRSHAPQAVLRVGSRLLAPFHELGARMMAMGYFSATTDVRCDDWEAAARRFGVAPMSVDQYLASGAASPPGAG